MMEVKDVKVYGKDDDVKVKKQHSNYTFQCWNNCKSFPSGLRGHIPLDASCLKVRVKSWLILDKYILIGLLSIHSFGKAVFFLQRNGIELRVKNWIRSRHPIFPLRFQVLADYKIKYDCCMYRTK